MRKTTITTALVAVLLAGCDTTDPRPDEFAPPGPPVTTVLTDADAYTHLIGVVQTILADPAMTATNAEARNQTVDEFRRDAEKELAYLEARGIEEFAAASTAAHCDPDPDFDYYATYISEYPNHHVVTGYTISTVPAWIETLVTAELGHRWETHPTPGYWSASVHAPEPPDYPWQCHLFVVGEVRVPKPYHPEYFVWGYSLHFIQDNDNNRMNEFSEALFIRSGDLF